MPTQEQVLAAILENVIVEALSGERDEQGHLDEESQEKIDKFLALLDDPEALRELAAEEGAEPEPEPETARMSGWQPYQTRRGHRAWLNPDTGQRRYQDTEPGLGGGGGGGGGAVGGAASAPVALGTYWDVAINWAQQIEEEYKGPDAPVQKAYQAAAHAYHLLRKWAGGEAVAVVAAALAVAAGQGGDPKSATAAGLALLLLAVEDQRDEPSKHKQSPGGNAVAAMARDAAEAASEPPPETTDEAAALPLDALLSEMGAPPAPAQQRMSHTAPDPDETMGQDAEMEALRSARQIARDFRRDLGALLKKKLSSNERMSQVNLLLHTWQQNFTALLGESILAGDLAGQTDVVRRMPAFPDVLEVLPMIQAYLPRLRQLDPASLRLFVSVLPPSYAEQLRIVAPDLSAKLPPPEPPGVAATTAGEEPKIRLWVVEEAVKELSERSVLTPRQFGLLEGEARQRAFTVAGQEGIEAVNKIRNLLAGEVSEGPSLPYFRQRLREEVEGSALGEARIETIFRTHIKHAYARGLERVLDNPLVGDEFPYIETVPIRDDRLSDLCRICSVSGIQNTGIFRRDDPVYRRIRPPRHYNCFVPETKVEGRFEIGLRSWYAGETVEIVTRYGHRLTVTPNHPVLTMQGFASAQSLRKGDRVLSYRGRTERQFAQRDAVGGVVRGSVLGANKKNQPVSIEQVFQSLANLGSVRSLPLTREDFHGDAVRGDGYVDVVGAIGELRLDMESDITDRCPHLQLSFSDVQLPLVARLGFLVFGSQAATSSSVAFRERGDSGFKSFRIGFSEPLTPQPLHIGSAANLDASRFQSLPQDVIANADFGSEFEERLALQVARRQALQIRDDDFGHGLALESHARFRGTEDDASAPESSSKSTFADADFATQLRDRFSSLVVLDEIVEIRYHQFRGHVYDLQSEGGWLVANGVFCSNCRCGIIPLSKEQAAAKGIKEAMEWVKSGKAPAMPAWVPMPDVEITNFMGG